jgi:hypothetical protein
MRRVAVGLALVASLSTAVVGCGGGAAPSPTPGPPTPPPATIVPSVSVPSVVASVGAPPSAPPKGSVVTVEVPGTGYVRLDESPGKVTRDGDTLIVETERGTFISTRIGYDLPDGTFPPDTVFSRIDMKLCGSGTGDFWEVYAPSGGEPLEQEVTQPADDGCWHFDGAAEGDPYFEAFVNGGSRMVIDKVVYTLTIG